MRTIRTATSRGLRIHEHVTGDVYELFSFSLSLIFILDFNIVHI